jgi:putative DNA-invertase from lambdoid prophage Rac
VVSAIDRLGRNTLDVMHTVETLKAKGVSVVSMREGFDLATPTGNFMLTMLAAMAQLERENIKIRQLAGLERARAEGKNLGREKTIDDNAVAQWREDNQASIKATAEHFDISIASVKRACSTSKVKA